MRVLYKQQVKEPLTPIPTASFPGRRAASITTMARLLGVTLRFGLPEGQQNTGWGAAVRREAFGPTPAGRPPMTL